MTAMAAMAAMAAVTGRAVRRAAGLAAVLVLIVHDAAVDDAVVVWCPHRCHRPLRRDLGR